MPMTFDEFRRSCESADDHRPLAVAMRQQQRSFRDRSALNVQRALSLITGWIPWDPDSAAGA